MNILFLTLLSFESLEEKTIYTDLLREFVNNGHIVYAISPVEKRHHESTHLIREKNAKILRLQIGNTQKTNIIEKGISTVLIEPAYIKAIKRYFSDVRFDLVLYSTPPITLSGVVEYVKKRDKSKTYLLLKDIFPQNAVDIGMLKTTGVKGILYKKFRNQEKKLYKISDRIGCMSRANVDYLLAHNPEVKSTAVEICPNVVEVVDNSVDANTRLELRKKYGIPVDKKVFVYGGNLGKPQGIRFLIECLKKCEDIEDVFFLIVGDGTEFVLLSDYIKNDNPKNVKLLRRLPKDDYDTMIGACDVGLIFLDHRFTIPNFPSRLLTYMQAKLPVFACTDPNTDIGDVINEGQFGWWIESKNAGVFKKQVKEILHSDMHRLGNNGYEYLNKHYSVRTAYDIIMNCM